MQQAFQFDLDQGWFEKERGLYWASLPKSQFLDIARAQAEAIALEKGEVTADDVFRALLESGADPTRLGNAWGSLFRYGFEFTGEWRKSSRVSNHARVNRVWRLKRKPPQTGR